MRGPVRLAAALVAVLACGGVGYGQTPTAAAPAAYPPIAGRWVGAKLRCQKDEGKLVRCGTPTGFEIRFGESGTGSTPDTTLPQEFSWRWLGAGELGVTPAGAGAGDELKLFAVERDEDALTFQAYVFLPTADPNAPAEARYIHYVFDVNLVPE